MNVNRLEKLVSPDDRDHASSAGDKANQDELKDDLEKYAHVDELASLFLGLNFATLRCRRRAKNPADLLKTFADWDLRDKRPSQFLVRLKSYRHQLAADANVAHEIHSSFCNP